MITRANLLICLFIVWACLSPRTAQATTVPSNITESQTWTAADSPYNITGNTTIAAGVTVTVETGTEVILTNSNPTRSVILTVDGTLESQAGVTFKFGTTTAVVKSSIDVYGTLIANGTSNNKIRFVPDTTIPTPGTWEGINIYDSATASGSAVFNHCIIQSGKTNINLRPSFFSNPSLTINNSEISYAYNDGIFLIGMGSLTVLNVFNSKISNNGLGTGGSGISTAWNDGTMTIIGNTISNNGDAGILTDGQVPNLTINTNVITGNLSGIKSSTIQDYPVTIIVGSPISNTSANYIFQNTQYGIQSFAVVQGDPDVKFTAVNNWWGSSTGPYNLIHNSGGTGNQVSNSVTFAPFSNGPVASLAPQSIDFGSMPVNTSTSQSIVLTNTGDIPLPLDTVTLSDPAQPDVFTIVSDTCSDTRLAPLASCTVNVSFAPTAGTAYSATVNIPAIDNTYMTNYPDPAVVNISGTGTVVPVSLTIGFLGTGGGTITYDSVQYDKDFTVLATGGAGVEFTAAADTYSTFAGWGGSCTGTGTCTFTAPGATGGVTATFNYKSSPVKIEPSSFFPSITGPGGAYEGAASAGSTIKTWGTYYTENMLFDLNKAVILDGGFDYPYSTNSGGMTTVKGSMTVRCVDAVTCGSVGVRNLTLRQAP